MVWAPNEHGYQQERRVEGMRGRGRPRIEWKNICEVRPFCRRLGYGSIGKLLRSD
jgi:hypothetical protein